MKGINNKLIILMLLATLLSLATSPFSHADGQPK